MIRILFWWRVSGLEQKAPVGVANFSGKKVSCLPSEMPPFSTKTRRIRTSSLPTRISAKRCRSNSHIASLVRRLTRLLLRYRRMLPNRLWPAAS